MAVQQSTGKCQFAFVAPAESRGQRLVQAQFNQHHAAQVGEGRFAAAAAALHLERLRVDGRGVAQVEARAVEGRQQVALVKCFRMTRFIGQRVKHLGQYFINQFPANGTRALAQGAVGNSDAGDGLHVGGESARAGEFMINPRHDPLPRR